MIKTRRLHEIAHIDISNIDKKCKAGEATVRLCNFVDVYHNWQITKSVVEHFMIATANATQINRFSIHSGQVAITKDSETRDDIGIPTLIADDFKDVVLGYHCALITPNENILLGSYLNVVLHTSYARKFFEANASGSGQRYTLTNDIIGNLPVPLPSIDEQRRIGNLFSSIDDKIANNKEVCTDLESIAKLLYDYWFIQFDFPDENGKPYKSSGGKMVWNEDLKREIPAGWKASTLSNIACLQQSSVFPTNNNNYHHYSIPAYDAGKYPSLEKGADIASNKLIVPPKSVLVSKLNPQFKRIWLIINPEDNAICSTEFLPMKANKTGLYVLYSLLNSDAFSIHLKQKASSSTGSRMRIDPENCMSFLFPFNDAVFMAFDRLVQPLFERMQAIPDDNHQLASLRDFLLPMLMNGQVRVRTGED